jgi:hypothetical protein
MATTWNRNVDSRLYHKQRADWVRTGRAVCGADISRPAFFFLDPVMPKNVRLCKHCASHQDKR